MNLRSSNNPYGSFSEGTDKRIGNAYPVIEAVHAKLAEISYIAENAENIQPGQIELRYVEETNSIEWKYSNLADWNILVVFPDYLGAADELVTAADITTADRAQVVIAKDAAVVSAANALASLNDFKGRWYGALASDPVLDPLGNAITVGDVYFNSTNNVLMVWEGSIWQSTTNSDAVALSTLASPSGSSLVGFQQSGVDSAVRTVESRLRETVSVSDKTDISDVAIFQAAIDHTPDGGVQVIHIPRGSYTGDMTTLDYGNRNVIWDEEAGVEYPTQFPVNTASKTRSQGPLMFSMGINPSLHLKQFSSRKTGSGAFADIDTVTVLGGEVTAVTLKTGGYGYNIPPRILISGDGEGATATATIGSVTVGEVTTIGVITGIVITNAGTGYTTATAYIANGPIVVVVGDSISTTNPSPSIPNESMWAVIQRSISEQNPQRKITFFNRGIGGTTWTNFNGMATVNLPSWYSGTSRPWMDYVEELQPDLVICAFGMNDRQNFVPSQMKAAVGKFATFATPPDVVLVTPLVPSVSSDSSGISSEDSQIGRDFVAGYLRGYSIVNNCGLIDLNRQLRLVRDGFDPRENALRYVSVTGDQALPLTLPVPTSSDFYLKITYPIVDVDFWTNRDIDILISPEGVNAHEYLRIVNTDGKIQIKIVEYIPGSETTSFQLSLAHSLDAPTSGSMEIEVICQDQWVNVVINDVLVFNQHIYRFGGKFTPKVKGNNNTGNVTIVFAVGEATRYVPLLTDQELWGYGTATHYAGNALNHPTSLCVKHVMSPVIHNSCWGMASLTHGTSLSNFKSSRGINEPDPVAELHITGTKYTDSDLIPSSEADTLALEDATKPGISLLSGPAGVARWVSGDSDNNTQWVMAYNHNNDSWSEILGGIVVRQVYSDVAVHHIPQRMPSHTKEDLPSASNNGAGGIIYVTDDVGGAVLAFTDGANWRRVTDRAIIS